MKNKFSVAVEGLKKFRFNSILFKNMVVIMLAVAVPIMAIGSASCILTNQTAVREVRMIAENKLSTIKNTIDMVISTAETFAIQTSLEESTEKLLLLGKQIETGTSVQYEVRKFIDAFVHTHDFIHSVYVYSEKGRLLVKNNDIVEAEDCSDNNWLEYYEKLDINDVCIIPRKYANRYPGFISVIRSVGIPGAKKTGAVIVNIDIEKIYDLIYNENQDQMHVFLLDSEDRVYLSQDIAMVGEPANNLEDLLTKKVLKNSSGDDSATQEDYHEFTVYSEFQDFRYIGAMSKSYMDDMQQYSVIYMSVIMVLLFIICTVIAVWVSMKTYAPIKSLLHLFSPVELNDLSDKNHSEISYISENIRKSINKNKELEQEINYKLMTLNRAQFYALQTQINPHFFNNVLEAINWTAISKIGIQNDISKMLRALSNLLDISLDCENYLIKIEDELKHANLYMYLMNEIYGDDLDFVWDFDEEIRKCQILKLTLQPVLENAIEHGIKPKKGKGRISISAKIVGNDIKISVQDDGAGMTEENLENLLTRLRQTNDLSGKHIGLKNINQRIKLVFGETYGISVKSKVNVGTTVEILIPMVKISQPEPMALPDILGESDT